MKRVVEHIKYGTLNFLIVVALLFFFVYGMNVTGLLNKSSSSLMGATVASTSGYGSLSVTGSVSVYREVLADYNVFVSLQAGEKFTLLISGEKEQVYRAIMAASEVADKRGELVEYELAKE